MRVLLAMAICVLTFLHDPRSVHAGETAAPSQGYWVNPPITPALSSPEVPLPAPSQPGKPWEKGRVALALNFGMLSAVGAIGLTLSVLPHSRLETELGVGLGGSGRQLSFMQKVLLASGDRFRFVSGLGLALAGGSSDSPAGTIWLNADLVGVELRTERGVFFFLSAGMFTALSGGRFNFLGGGDCGQEFCSSAKGEIFPQGRLGIGGWF